MNRCPICKSTWIVDITAIADIESKAYCLDCDWQGLAVETLDEEWIPVPPKPKRISPWRSIDDE